MTIFHTSDTHFGHKRIIELCNRPFSDVNEMNWRLVHNWNKVVEPSDTVYHHGDVALGSIEESLALVKQLNGHKILIVGNHDRNFQLAKKSRGMTPDEWNQVYLDAGFDDILYSMIVEYGGTQFQLSHFPYTGDSHDGDRFEEVRLKDYGTSLLHGHTHSRGRPVTYTDRGTMQVHVGVDAWNFTPVSEHEITALVRAAR